MTNFTNRLTPSNRPTPDYITAVTTKYTPVRNSVTGKWAIAHTRKQHTNGQTYMLSKTASVLNFLRDSDFNRLLFPSEQMAKAYITKLLRS